MDWNFPALDGPLRGAPNDLLNSLKGRDADIATMFDGSTTFSEIPLNTKRLTNSGVLSRWNGSTWLPFNLSLSSGGTGANTAAGARTSLSVYSKGEVDGFINGLNVSVNGLNTSVGELDSSKADKSITITGQSPLTGGGNLSQNRTLGIQDATTGQKGAVQLNNTISSTSTTQAATANAVKTVNDKYQPLGSTAGSYVGRSVIGARQVGLSQFAPIETQVYPSYVVGGPTESYRIYGSTGDIPSGWQPLIGTWRLMSKVSGDILYCTRIT